MKKALEIQEEFPTSDVYIIPVRLADCTISDHKVRRIQYVDLFLDWQIGFEKILRAMKIEQPYKRSDVDQLKNKLRKSVFHIEIASNNRLCYVIMPFGRKIDYRTGSEIDFDSIYKDIISPSIKQAGLEPWRADEEKVGGIIHKRMFEALILSKYVVADLTTANANVFYELGIRHAFRSTGTVLCNT